MRKLLLSLLIIFIFAASAFAGPSMQTGPTYNPASVAITGGTVDNVPIGNTTPSTGKFTQVTTTAADGYRSFQIDTNTVAPTITNGFYFLNNVFKIGQNGTMSTVAIGPSAGQVSFTGPTAARSYAIPDRAGQIPLINNTFTHDYGNASTTKAMTAAEASAQFISVSNASGDVELNIPAAIPGKIYLIYNNTGHVLTFKVLGETGGTIATGKYALYMSHATDVIEIFEQ